MSSPPTLLVCTVTDVAACYDKCKPREGACEKTTRVIEGPTLSI